MYIKAGLSFQYTIHHINVMMFDVWVLTAAFSINCLGKAMILKFPKVWK